MDFLHFSAHNKSKGGRKNESVQQENGRKKDFKNAKN